MDYKSNWGLRRLDQGPRSVTLDKETKSSLLQRHLGQFNDLLKVQPQRHTEQQLKIEREEKKRQQQEGEQSELERIRQRYQVSNKSGKGLVLSEDDFEDKRRDMIKRQRALERMRNEEEAVMLQYTRNDERLTNKVYKPKWYEREHQKKMKDVLSKSEQLWKASDRQTTNNVWARRQEFQNKKAKELQELLPQNEADEELMLRQAIELSRQSAQETTIAQCISTKQPKSIWDIEPESSEGEASVYQPTPDHCGYAMAVKNKWTNALVPESRFTGKDKRLAVGQSGARVDKENLLPTSTSESINKTSMSTMNGPFYKRTISKFNEMNAKTWADAQAYNKEGDQMVDKSCKNVTDEQTQNEPFSKCGEDWDNDSWTVVGKETSGYQHPNTGSDMAVVNKERKQNKSVYSENSTSPFKKQRKQNLSAKLENNNAEGCVWKKVNQPAELENCRTAISKKRKGNQCDDSEIIKPTDGKERKRKQPADNQNKKIEVSKRSAINKEHFRSTNIDSTKSLAESSSDSDSFPIPSVSFCKSKRLQTDNVPKESGVPKSVIALDKAESTVLKSEINHAGTPSKPRDVPLKNVEKAFVPVDQQKGNQLLLNTVSRDKNTSSSVKINNQNSSRTGPVDIQQDGKGHFRETLEDGTHNAELGMMSSQLGDQYPVKQESNEHQQTEGIPHGLPGHLHQAYLQYLQQSKEQSADESSKTSHLTNPCLNQGAQLFDPFMNPAATGGYYSEYTMKLMMMQAQEMMKQCQIMPTESFTPGLEATLTSQPEDTNANCTNNLSESGQNYEYMAYKNKKRPDKDVCDPRMEDGDEQNKDYTASTIRLKGKLDMSSSSNLRIPRLPSVASRLTKKYIKSLNIDSTLYSGRKRSMKTKDIGALKTETSCDPDNIFSFKRRVEFNNNPPSQTNDDDITLKENSHLGSHRNLFTFTMPKKDMTDEDCGWIETGDVKRTVGHQNEFHRNTGKIACDVTKAGTTHIKGDSRPSSNPSTSDTSRQSSYQQMGSTQNQLFQKLVVKEYGGMAASSDPKCHVAMGTGDGIGLKKMPDSDQSALEQNKSIRNMIKEMRLKEQCGNKPVESGDAPSTRIF